MGSTAYSNRCPVCLAPPFSSCLTVSNRKSTTHQARIRVEWEQDQRRARDRSAAAANRPEGESL
jgi:hypothetical protein